MDLMKWQLNELKQDYREQGQTGSHVPDVYSDCNDVVLKPWKGTGSQLAWTSTSTSLGLFWWKFGMCGFSVETLVSSPSPKKKHCSVDWTSRFDDEWMGGWLMIDPSCREPALL